MSTSIITYCSTHPSKFIHLFQSQTVATHPSKFIHLFQSQNCSTLTMIKTVTNRKKLNLKSCEIIKLNNYHTIIPVILSLSSCVSLSISTLHLCIYLWICREIRLLSSKEISICRTIY